MTIDQMKYFLAAAKYQSVTMAGKSVHISPSAVSSAIASMEDELGLKLFRREGKSIFLTDHGRKLQVELERIFDDLDNVKRLISGDKNQFDGEYRLGGSHYLANRLLARIWSSVQNEHPKLRGELISMHTSLILSQVTKGTIDFALCFSPQEHPAYVTKRLHVGQLRIAVRKKHPLLKLKGTAAYKELSKYPAIIHKSSPGVEICENHPIFQKLGITADVRSYFDSDDQAIECVAGSDSWTMIPDICLKENKDKIEFLPLVKEWDAPYNIATVYPTHRSESPLIAQMEKEISRALKIDAAEKKPLRRG